MVEVTLVPLSALFTSSHAEPATSKHGGRVLLVGHTPGSGCLICRLPIFGSFLPKRLMTLVARKRLPIITASPTLNHHHQTSEQHTQMFHQRVRVKHSMPSPSSPSSRSPPFPSFHSPPSPSASPLLAFPSPTPLAPVQKAPLQPYSCLLASSCATCYLLYL